MAINPRRIIHLRRNALRIFVPIELRSFGKTFKSSFIAYVSKLRSWASYVELVILRPVDQAYFASVNRHGLGKSRQRPFMCVRPSYAIPVLSPGFTNLNAYSV